MTPKDWQDWIDDLHAESRLRGDMTLRHRAVALRQVLVAAGVFTAGVASVAQAAPVAALNGDGS